MQTGDRKSAMKVLEETSRTFFIPIVGLPPVCQQAVASAYLALRTINEIEEHPTLDVVVKERLLRKVSFYLQKIRHRMKVEELTFDRENYSSELSDVTLRLAERIFYTQKHQREDG